MSVTQAVRVHAPPHARREHRGAQRRAGARTTPRAPGCRPGDDRKDGPDRQRLARLKPRSQLLPAPVVHPDQPTFAALAAAHEDAVRALVEVGFAKVERFADPQARAPQQHEQAAEALTGEGVGARLHHGDDLADARRVRGVALALAARRAAAVKLRERGGRAPAPADVEQGSVRGRGTVGLHWSSHLLCRARERWRARRADLWAQQATGSTAQPDAKESSRYGAISSRQAQRAGSVSRTCSAATFATGTV